MVTKSSSTETALNNARQCIAEEEVSPSKLTAEKLIEIIRCSQTKYEAIIVRVCLFYANFCLIVSF